jgi:hypothetical protein
MPGSVTQPLTLVGTKRRSRAVGVCTAPGLNNVPLCGAAFPLGRVQGARGRGMWVEVDCPLRPLAGGARLLLGRSRAHVSDGGSGTLARPTDGPTAAAALRLHIAQLVPHT